jgi:hypothetical protein
VQSKPVAESITPLVQRQDDDDVNDEEEPGPEPEEEPAVDDEGVAQYKSEGPEPAPAGVATQVQSLQGRGEPLSDSNRAFFEPRFGADLSQVRLHTGAEAAAAARAVKAKAFTIGKNVVMGAGQGSPETSAGKSLLAHELTHVMQQNEDIRRSRDSPEHSRRHSQSDE